MTTATTIRARRVKAGLTQPQLAEKVGTRWQRISEWERGVQRPSARYAVALWRALGGKAEDYLPK